MANDASIEGIWWIVYGGRDDGNRSARKMYQRNLKPQPDHINYHADDYRASNHNNQPK